MGSLLFDSVTGHERPNFELNFKGKDEKGQELTNTEAPLYITLAEFVNEKTREFSKGPERGHDGPRDRD
jgi:hypothetical protein